MVQNVHEYIVISAQFYLLAVSPNKVLTDLNILNMLLPDHCGFLCVYSLCVMTQEPELARA